MFRHLASAVARSVVLTLSVATAAHAQAVRGPDDICGSDLGVRGPVIGEPSAAPLMAINNVGQVAAGNVLCTPGEGLRDLGTLGDPTAVRANKTHASAINDAGQVVGWSETGVCICSYAPSKYRAFIWTADGGIRDLGGPRDHFSVATGINKAGQVVGTISTYPGLNSRAFLWTANKGMVELGTLGGFTSPTAINNAGQVVGMSNGHAFLWTRTGGMRDLGTLGGPRSEATDINDAGQVVGWSYSNSSGVLQAHAFLWTAAGGMVDLGMPPGAINSKASGINNAGQVVGVYTLGGLYPLGLHGGRSIAFVWTATHGMTDLPGVGGEALGVNEAGRVVGTRSSYQFEHVTSWTYLETSDEQGDFDGDGRDDLLWRNSTGAVTIWLMNGRQAIGGGLLGTVDPTWQPLGTADYNGDGRADILWRSTSGEVGLWLMNGTRIIGGGSLGTVDSARQLIEYGRR